MVLFFVRLFGRFLLRQEVEKLPPQSHRDRVSNHPERDNHRPIPTHSTTEMTQRIERDYSLERRLFL